MSVEVVDMWGTAFSGCFSVNLISISNIQIQRGISTQIRLRDVSSNVSLNWNKLPTKRLTPLQSLKSLLKTYVFSLNFEHNRQ